MNIINKARSTDIYSNQIKKADTNAADKLENLFNPIPESLSFDA